MVDRGNLGEQAETEFRTFRTPDDNRLFPELYGIQRLTSNTIGTSSKVVISTIQRLYSILKGEPELDPEAEEHTDLDDDLLATKEPLPVVYNKAVPPEFFDIIFIDECHRSIYSLWRQTAWRAFVLSKGGVTTTPQRSRLSMNTPVSTFGHVCLCEWSGPVTVTMVVSLLSHLQSRTARQERFRPAPEGTCPR